MKHIFLFSIFCFFASGVHAMEISPEQIHSLVKNAQSAREKAYAPYSLYRVGSALLTESGEVILGCNVENASYGLCNCAERSAVFSALSQNQKNFQAIAVVTKDGGSPCGACRQVLNEFNPNILVIIAKENGEIVAQKTLTELLPHAFGPKNIEDSVECRAKT